MFAVVYPSYAAVADPQAVARVLSGELKEANVLWWGFDPDDSAEYLQAAIDSGANRLTLPNVGREWVVRPIFLRSNLELIFEEGVVVTAKKGAYLGTRDSVFTIRDVHDVAMRGYGATIRMHKKDYTAPPYQPGAWRMGIRIDGSKNVEISGLTVRDTGGDGIIVGSGSVTFETRAQQGIVITTQRHSENVVIRDVVVDNNHRQGVSIINVSNLLIENTVFKNTSGTAPMAGIDFEPDHADQILEGIVVRNCVFENNEVFGVTINTQRLTRKSVPVSILLEGVLIRGGRDGFNVFGGDTDDQPKGEIVLRNCIIENTRQTGIRLRGKDSDALKITIDDCVLHDVAIARNQEFLARSVPIYLEAGKRFGCLNLSGITVIDDKDRPVLYGAVLSPNGEVPFVGIKGWLQVVNPHGADVRWDGPTADVSITTRQIDAFEVPYEKTVKLPDYAVGNTDVENPDQIGPSTGDSPAIE